MLSAASHQAAGRHEASSRPPHSAALKSALRHVRSRGCSRQDLDRPNAKPAPAQRRGAGDRTPRVLRGYGVRRGVQRGSLSGLSAGLSGLPSAPGGFLRLLGGGGLGHGLHRPFAVHTGLGGALAVDGHGPRVLRHPSHRLCMNLGHLVRPHQVGRCPVRENQHTGIIRTVNDNLRTRPNYFQAGLRTPPGKPNVGPGMTLKNPSHQDQDQ